MRRIILLLAISAAAFAQQLQVGQLLVATPKSHDPELARSVILVIHSDRDGLMGLILNHDSRGGPIDIGVRTLIRSSRQPENAEAILRGVYLTSNRLPKTSGRRSFSGYTGWSAQQLRDEVALGLWKIVPGSAALVFDPNPATLWARLSGNAIR